MKKHLKTAFLSALLICGRSPAADSFGAVKTLPPAPRLSPLRPVNGAVKIFVRNPSEKISVGSGFFIDESGVLVTAFHVIDSVKSIEDIRFIDMPIGEDVALQRSLSFTEITALDPIADIAVLKAEGYKPKKIYPVTGGMDKNRAPALKDIVISGFQSNITSAVQTMRGEIKKLEGDIPYFINIHIDKRNLNERLSGMSGGPVAFENGDLAGMVSQGLTENLTAVSVKSIHKALKNKPLSCPADECIKEAFRRLYEKGAGGDKSAQFALADLAYLDKNLYESYFGADAPSACEWFQRAAAKGLIMAQYYMRARCGCQESLPETIAWHEKACSGGLFAACNVLETLRLSAADTRQAVTRARQAAEEARQAAEEARQAAEARRAAAD